jgi:hypothetical protein
MSPELLRHVGFVLVVKVWVGERLQGYALVVP